MTTPADIVLGSLIGDALALGPHWVYDQKAIREKLGLVTTYQAPISSYHPGKVAGGNTHYGDQTLVLLRTIAKKKTFDLPAFASDWRAFWENPETISYRDGATRATLANLQAGHDAPSDSADIAGAARIAPLFLLEWPNDRDLLEAVRAETSLTHGDPEVIGSAVFFAKVVIAVRSGTSVPDALRLTMEGDEWQAISTGWLDAATKSAASDATDSAALESHGLSCHTADAFPGICHLLLRYPGDPATALIENASAGGDSAARGMILGMVYGAIIPVSTWPTEWLSNLKAKSEVEELAGVLS